MYVSNKKNGKVIDIREVENGFILTYSSGSDERMKSYTFDTLEEVLEYLSDK